MEKKFNIQEIIYMYIMNQNKFIHAQNSQGETVPVLDFWIIGIRKIWGLRVNLKDVGDKF